MPNDFGVFSPILDSPHGYLVLLNLATEDSVASVNAIKACCMKPSSLSDASLLLEESNWRPTLVACVASLFMGHTPEITKRLWHRLDRGSWVTPQLAVVLSMTDPEFEHQARRRLENHCPLDATDLLAMTMPERHSAEGPAGGTARSAKAAASLGWLSSLKFPDADWLKTLQASAEHQALKSEDIDSSGAIAEKWHHRIAEVLKRVSSG
ncbi:MAG: hypothetical protein IAE77_30730 [Prosthecobacter sp.]|jgi:hypothetical protein|uniref:hypothetical protein n=1 Tax=Prosthecobacter sp. TaxID=1965333 RepID=UPI001A03CFDB|nr:hypothetical protein [Prosthecobacter sp.]MBE2287874.1 hypothetical protein [Prosthecobacter sp.]